MVEAGNVFYLLNEGHLNGIVGSAIWSSLCENFNFCPGCTKLKYYLK
jgi:hypothetical protein